MEVRKATAEDIPLIAKLVSESNKDVALKFGINLENYPKPPLRDAQRAWLSFRDTEANFWWTEGISGGGTYSIELLKARVCQLTQYKTAHAERY